MMSAAYDVTKQTSAGKQKQLLQLALIAALFLAGLMVGCAPAEARLSLPEEIGAWKRDAETPLDANSMPEALRRLEAISGVRANYRSGELEVVVTVYQMPSGTSAFEAVQTYPRQANEYYFQKGASFVVLGLGELPLEARRPFLMLFQSATSPDGPDKAKE